MKLAGKSRRRAIVGAIVGVAAAATTALTILPSSAAGNTAAARPQVSQTAGLDVSNYQGNVNWSSVKSHGAKFAYILATSSTNFTNRYFAQQYNGSYKQNIIRGAYHFANPARSSGAAQADFFVRHGGGWSKDGRTLPGALDLENVGYEPFCYGLSKSSMGAWIRSFSNEYHKKTSRYPVIYTRTSWWDQCVSSAYDFHNTNPLWIANYNGTTKPLPYHWTVETIWQWAGHPVTFPGDQDRFNGDASRVRALANG
ncbi:MAG: lysozyme [Sciscionella sp.]|nr:lysozyme [Sciscionella sp.]